jgi:hypothetical protein
MSMAKRCSAALNLRAASRSWILIGAIVVSRFVFGGITSPPMLDVARLGVLVMSSAASTSFQSFTGLPSSVRVTDSTLAGPTPLLLTVQMNASLSTLLE